MQTFCVGFLRMLTAAEMVSVGAEPPEGVVAVKSVAHVLPSPAAARRVDACGERIAQRLDLDAGSIARRGQRGPGTVPLDVFAYCAAVVKAD